MSTELQTILVETDNLVNDFLHPKAWIATLPFMNCTICTTNDDIATGSVHTTDVDLFDYCKFGKKANHYSKSHIVRFDPNAYPVEQNENGPFGSSSVGSRLLTDLMLVCHRDGRCKYVCNGSTNDKNSRRLVCHYLKVIAGITNESEPKTNVYTQCMLRQKNVTVKKDTMKRTLSARARDNQSRCKSFLVVNVDATSYYMKIGTGNATHSNHAPHDLSIATLRRRLIPGNVIKNIKDLGFYKVSNRSIVKMSEAFDCRITRRQVVEIAKYSHLAANIHVLDDSIPRGSIGVSDPDQMVEYFRVNCIPHILLTHHRDLHQYELQGESMHKKKTVTQANTGPDDKGYIAIECDGNTVPTDGVIVPEDDLNAILSYSINSRNSLILPDQQSMLLSFVWSAPHCRRLFQAFPEVLYIDGTHNTNREKMPLLTVGIRDHDFKVNVVVRAFIPNERSWLFRWIFHHGIPSLMGKDACKKVKLIVTDGDSQEITQLDNALRSNIYGEARRRRCGWHIVEKGTTFHLRYKGDAKTNKIVSLMKLWIQESLMKDVETKDEYERSKQLLIDFITSDITKAEIGEQFAANVITFLRDYVFPVEDHFASFHYNTVRSFDEYSNTPLEGTNNAVKHCTIGVKGNMPLHVSSVNMVNQDLDKLEGKKRSIHESLHKSRLCDLNDECGKFIVKRAYGQLKQQIKEGEQSYASVRTGKYTWIVMRSTDRSKTKILPVFERKRHVTWKDSRLVECDCHYTRRWGLPCRHIAHVTKYYSKTPRPFTHHDVDIRWWTIYAQAMVLFDPNSIQPQEQIIKDNIGKIYNLQCHVYPMIDEFKDFINAEYSYGPESSGVFQIMNVATAIETFRCSRTRILNYPESSTCTSTAGITKTVYLGDETSDSDFASETFDSEFAAPDQASEDDDSCIDDNDSKRIAQQQLVSKELESRKKSRLIKPYELFGPLFKELVAVSDGDTAEELESTSKGFQQLINLAKARRAKLMATKTVGVMTTCTLGNSTKRYKRFNDPKQKLFR